MDGGIFHRDRYLTELERPDFINRKVCSNRLFANIAKIISIAGINTSAKFSRWKIANHSLEIIVAFAANYQVLVSICCSARGMVCRARDPWCLRGVNNWKRQKFPVFIRDKLNFSFENPARGAAGWWIHFCIEMGNN